MIFSYKLKEVLSGKFHLEKEFSKIYWGAIESLRI